MSGRVGDVQEETGCAGGCAVFRMRDCVDLNWGEEKRRVMMYVVSEVVSATSGRHWVWRVSQMAAREGFLVPGLCKWDNGCDVPRQRSHDVWDRRMPHSAISCLFHIPVGQPHGDLQPLNIRMRSSG